MNKKFFIGLAVLLTLISGIVIGKYFLSGNKNVSPVSGVAPVKMKFRKTVKIFPKRERMQ
ncbi:MAG: hypothetical protein IPJ45_13765 [Ignavibacteria bacterium]|nr:hypothetical protein [Ignavibacteria bacterium]